MPWKIATFALVCVSAILAWLLVQQVQQQASTVATYPVPGPRYDRAYVKLMIAQHQKSINEAKTAAKEAWHPELISLAKQIAASRQAELNNMLQWSEVWWDERHSIQSVVSAGKSDAKK
ncbi:MAG: DUF305 domain-containing protein [Candidatus Obscuribacterales bacterium]|nr:DUF305 domain-containing protein [Candidatus Obscuribacterales bacterium]